MSVSIVTVKSQSDIHTFIDAQWLFYKNDPNFVPPLKMDRKKLLNKKVNPFYKHAEIEKIFHDTYARTCESFNE